LSIENGAVGLSQWVRQEAKGGLTYVFGRLMLPDGTLPSSKKFKSVPQRSAPASIVWILEVESQRSSEKRKISKKLQDNPVWGLSIMRCDGL